MDKQIDKKQTKMFITTLEICVFFSVISFNNETGQDQYNEEQKVSLGWEPKLRGKKNTNTE